jgi:hypothetical protein
MLFLLILIVILILIGYAAPVALLFLPSPDGAPKVFASRQADPPCRSSASTRHFSLYRCNDLTFHDLK